MLDETYLIHHGILGQKWGIRRYQNPDGSLTEEGTKRYNAMNDYQKHHFNKEMEKRDEWKRTRKIQTTIAAIGGAKAGITLAIDAAAIVAGSTMIAVPVGSLMLGAGAGALALGSKCVESYHNAKLSKIMEE